ncbi:uncharacterized protein [Panulirus ornatus]|uniref:uncharacterized protein n=1 Tax=Panulirus ornatus TaxID=150431 RepID=UPI003A852F2D
MTPSSRACLVWMLLLVAVDCTRTSANSVVAGDPSRSPRVSRQAGGRLSGLLGAVSQAVRQVGSNIPNRGAPSFFYRGGQDGVSGHVGTLHSRLPSGRQSGHRQKNPPIIYGSHYRRNDPCSRERYDRWGRLVSQYYRQQTYDRWGRPCPRRSSFTNSRRG